MGAAFWLAMVGIALSVASLTWQFATFRLTGSLVRAELRHGGAGHGGISSGSPGAFDVSRMAEQGFGMEVIGIEVFNRGRIGVNVVGWKIKTGKESYTPVADQIGPHLPHRLEPGASAQWFMQMDAMRNVVRVSAGVLGRPNPAEVWAIVQLGNGKTVKAKGKMSVRGGRTGPDLNSD